MTCRHGFSSEWKLPWNAGDRSYYEADKSGNEYANLLSDFSACDCCNNLMYKETGDYWYLATGETLCDACYEGQELMKEEVGV